MALHSQRDRLDALQKQKRAQRRQHCPGRPLVDSAAATKIGALAEMLAVDQAVIGRVWLIEHREAGGVLFPIEITAVDDGSAEGRAVAAHKLGKRMHNNVGAIFDRPQQDRRGDRVIHDQGHSMTVGHARQTLDVADISCRVAYALAEHRARVVVDQLFDCFRMVRLRESDTDSLAGQKVSE